MSPQALALLVLLAGKPQDEGRPLRAWDSPRPIEGLAVSPDGESVATASTEARVRTWDLARGGERRVYEGPALGCSAVVYSSNGRQIAAAGEEGRVFIWDIATGDLVRRLEAGDGVVRALARSPDGGRLAAAGERVLAWSWADGLELFRTPSDAVSLAFSSDGARLAAGSSRRRVLWLDAKDGSVQSRQDERGAALAVDADSFYVQAGPGTVLRLSAELRELARYALPSGSIRSLAVSTSGLLAAGTEERSVHVWAVRDGRHLKTWMGHRLSVSALAFTPDGASLVTAGPDRRVAVWDVRHLPR